VSSKLSQHDIDLSFLVAVENVQSHAIISLDPEGLIKSWNAGAERITDWKADEAIGKCLDLLYTDEDKTAKKHEQDVQAALKKGSYQEETTYTKKDGTRYLADMSITKVTTGKDGVGFVLIAKDTTQRKQDEVDQIDANTLLRAEIDRRKTIEKALKESNDELEAFASAAGHDLQEPLRMVVSYLQLIVKRYSKSLDEDGLVFLEFAVDGATRMKMLISDLVEYSRIDTLGKPFKETNASQVLEDVLDSMEVLIRESGAKITYDKLPVVWSDKVQLNELLQNLLANAIKFGKQGSASQLKVHVGVHENAREFVFSVSDTGPGIDKKYFKIIFLIFKQLGNKSLAEGSGVGLAICKKIVKRHHGRIWVESEIGKGSTFYFSIPRSKEAQ
jgi:PAS domain S-box-containing protein